MQQQDMREKSLNWRLLALDMDGTTIRHNETLSPENRKWLLRVREAGIPFTFATGRHRNGVVQSFVKELAIEVPIVTVNGSEVWTHDGVLLQRNSLEPDDIKWLFQLTQELQTNYWGATTAGPVRQDNFPAAQHLTQHTWLKFGYWSSDPQVITELWNRLEETNRFELSNSDPSNIEVNPKGVNKATGIQVVCDAMGIQPNQVIGIGDSLNDLPMFRFVGYPVAMGNAQPVLKDAAREITGRCEEDGVAAFIRRLLNAND